MQYGRFKDIKSIFGKKKLQRTNQGSNFLGDRFSDRDNITAPIRKKRHSQCLKWCFFWLSWFSPALKKSLLAPVCRNVPSVIEHYCSQRLGRFPLQFFQKILIPLFFVLLSTLWFPKCKKVLSPSETFKLSLLGCQYGHTIVRRNTH